MERLKFTTINLGKLTASQMDLFKLIWLDLVEFTNQSLIIPPVSHLLEENLRNITACLLYHLGGVPSCPFGVG